MGMRVFRVENDKVVDEVKAIRRNSDLYDETERHPRIAGVYDGIHLATKSGDGEYDLDFGNGSVMRIEVKDGRASKTGPQAIRNVALDDMPHRGWDRGQTNATVRAPIGRFGAIFGDEDVPAAANETDEAQAAPPRESAGPAYEEF